MKINEWYMQELNNLPEDCDVNKRIEIFRKSLKIFDELIFSLFLLQNPVITKAINSYWVAVGGAPWTLTGEGNQFLDVMLKPIRDELDKLKK